MRQLPVRVLEGINDVSIDKPVEFAVTTPDGRVLGYDDVVGSVPAVTSAYDGLNRPQLKLASSTGLPLWDEKQQFPVGRLDKHHGRNLEILADKVTISDEYGRSYVSSCIKGSDFSSPMLFKTLTAARGLIVYGLQESPSVQRVVKASKLLRAAGVEAEYIYGLAMPESFPVPDNELGIDSHATTKLPGLLDLLSGRYAAENPDPEQSPLAIKSEIIERLDDMDYLITYRAMDSPYRARDISNPERFKALKQFLVDNYPLGRKREKLLKYSPLEYTYIIYSTKLARNTSKAHKNGLAHGFLTDGNTSALGSWVDLDSCHGEPLELNDEAITTKDKANDIVYAIKTLNGIIKNLDLPIDEQQPRMAQTVYHFLETYFLEQDGIKRREKSKLLAEAITQAAADQEIDHSLLAMTIVGVCNSFMDDPRSRTCLNAKLEVPTAAGAHESLEEEYGRNYLPPIFFEKEQGAIKEALQKRTEQLLSGEQNYEFNSIILELTQLDRRNFITAYRTDGTVSQPDQLLSALCYKSGLIPKDLEHIKHAKALHELNFTQLTAFLTDRATVKLDSIPESLSQFLIKRDPTLLERVGKFKSTPISPDHELPVLYLDSQKQYRLILSGLLKDRNAALIPRSLSLVDDDNRDAVLICDYRRLIMKQAHTILSAKDNLFAYVALAEDVFSDQIPSVLIRGLSSDNPEVIIISNKSPQELVSANVLGQIELPFDIQQPQSEQERPAYYSARKAA